MRLAGPRHGGVTVRSRQGHVGAMVGPGGVTVRWWGGYYVLFAGAPFLESASELRCHPCRA